MIARIHDDGEPKVGSMISLNRLAIRFGKGADWIRRQGITVSHLGETWQAVFYNGGRRQGYELISRSPPPMRVQRTVQQDHAAAMK